MICRHCGNESPEGTRFCTNCGKDLYEPAQVVNTAPVDPVAQIPEEYKPISPWGYFGLSLLFSIPIAGFIMLIVYSFKGGNIHRKNYARSHWCALLVAAIIALVWFAIVMILVASGTAAYLEYM